MGDNLKLLFKIDEQLDSDEVACLKFLCSDHLGRKHLENVKDARELFLRLRERGHLEEDLVFLKELLQTIRRNDLVRLIPKSEREQTMSQSLQQDTYTKISIYRKMLYNIAAEMETEQITSFKFLVNLPRGKAEASATMLDVLSEMEKQEMITEDNVNALVEILEKIDVQLAAKVNEYRSKETERGDSQPVGENGGHLPAMECLSLSDNPETQDNNLISRDRGESVVSDVSPVSDNEPNSQEGCYQMTAHPRGICLVIDNYEFLNGHRPRKGTWKDADDLEKVFTMLHFNVIVERDLSSSDLREIVQRYARMDHSKYNAFIMCVLSHGLERCVLGVDGVEVLIKDIYKPFTRTPSLAGKPKVFFIQACQGSKLQTGQPIQEDGLEDPTMESYEEDAINPLADRQTVPIEADVLIGMATVEEYKAFRHITNGSIYIQALCKALKEGCPKREDIHTILTRVNNIVSKGDYSHYKQMPQPQYTLTKKLCFTLD